MSRLIVIGNGFDLAHGIGSSYFSFRDHLKERKGDLYESLLRLADQNIWYNFEENLANLDLPSLIDGLLDDNGLLNSSNPNFNNRSEISSAQSVEWTLHRVVRQLTDELRDELREWILLLDGQPASAMFNCIDWDDQVLSFNYTSTVERLYEVWSSNILYIHNRAVKDFESFNFSWACNHSPQSLSDYLKDEPPRLILGHGNRCVDRNMPAIPVSSMTSDYDFNVAHSTLYRAFESAYEYYDLSRKKVEDILPVLESFLERVGDLDEVLIIGHSLSSVDQDYFRVITRHASGTIKYTITYYGDQNRGEVAGNAQQFVRQGDAVEFIDMSKANKLIL